LRHVFNELESRFQQITGRAIQNWVEYTPAFALLYCLSAKMSVPTLFDAIFGQQRRQRTALIYQHRQITYGELKLETIQVALALQSLGVEKGQRVAILLHDSPEFVASFVAIQSLGAIAVPINMGLSVPEQRSILNDCAARTSIVETGICNTTLTDARDNLQHLAEVMIIDRGADALPSQIDGLNFTLYDQTHTLAENDFDLVDFPCRLDDETPGFILYTSGSTGEPKGAIHCQSDVFYTNETFCKQVLALGEDDRLFSSSRLPFAYGLGNSFSFPLLNGVTSVLCFEKPTPEVISRIFGDYRPTIFFAVPVVYNLLLEHHRSVAPLDCSSLRVCVSAGEALPAAIGEEWQRTFGIPVLDGIGSTEMLHMFMSNHQGAVRYGSSGKLLNGYEAQLLDQNGAPTPDGEIGNLWVRGASAARGYWERPETSAQTFIDGWVRTGDLYRCDPDGYWFHMGRSDDCFKSSGQWVSPVEVEGVLLRSAKVSRVAVVEDFDEDGLPCACAFVVCEEVESRRELIEQELRQLMEDSLPRFKRPRKYLFVGELPYTATGKIQRFKLREHLRNYSQYHLR
jgi:benzoate-CoA ligase family protein